MKETIRNSQIKELYLRKYLKEQLNGKHSWRHYALIKANDKWLWANDYLNKGWKFEKGKNYDFYIHTFLKGKNKGKSFIYDYCLSDKLRELRKQFRKQWVGGKIGKSA